MRVAIFGASDREDYRQALSDLPGIEVVEADVGQPLDGAIVCAAIPEHQALIEEAIALTDRVLCEVPFSLTQSDTEDIIQMCHARGIKLYPAFSSRQLPVFQSLKTMIEQKNTLGQILSVKLQQRAQKLSPGSSRVSLLPNIMHVVDLLRWLLDTEITELYSEAIEDGAILSVALANGAYATLDVSLSLPPAYPAPNDLELEMIGTSGWVRIDAYRQIVEAFSAQGAIRANWGSNPVRELVAAFIAGRDFATTQDALRAQEIALSVFGLPETR